MEKYAISLSRLLNISSSKYGQFPRGMYTPHINRSCGKPNTDLSIWHHKKFFISFSMLTLNSNFVLNSNVIPPEIRQLEVVFGVAVQVDIALKPGMLSAWSDQVSIRKIKSWFLTLLRKSILLSLLPSVLWLKPFIFQALIETLERMLSKVAITGKWFEYDRVTFDKLYLIYKIIFFSGCVYVLCMLRKVN